MELEDKAIRTAIALLSMAHEDPTEENAFKIWQTVTTLVEDQRFTMEVLLSVLGLVGGLTSFIERSTEGAFNFNEALMTFVASYEQQQSEAQ